MGLSIDFGTPVNTAFLLYILYSIQRIIFPSTSSAKPESIPNEFKAGYSWIPKSHPPTLLYQVYTPKTLEPFSGKDDGRILLAINSIVFDVTAGRSFYGPSEFVLQAVWVEHGIDDMVQDGMYGNFAGRDASRGMAKQSFDIGTHTSEPPASMG